MTKVAKAWRLAFEEDRSRMGVGLALLGMSGRVFADHEFKIRIGKGKDWDSVEFVSPSCRCENQDVPKRADGETDWPRMLGAAEEVARRTYAKDKNR